MDIRDLKSKLEVIDTGSLTIGIAQSQAYQLCEDALFDIISENLKKLGYNDKMEKLFKEEKLKIVVTEEGLKHYIIGDVELLYHTFPAYRQEGLKVECEIKVYNLI